MPSPRCARSTWRSGAGRDVLVRLADAEGIVVRSATQVEPSSSRRLPASGSSASGDRRRQHRPADGDRPRGARRQRSSCQHDLGGRAHHGPPPQPGPQHPRRPCQARLGGVGPQELPGGRARRQDPRGHRARQDRHPRRPALPRFRDAAPRLRPVRHRGPWPAARGRDRRPRPASSPRPTSSPSTSRRRERPRDFSVARTSPASSRGCASSTRPGAGSSTRRPSPTRSSPGGWRGRRSTSSPSSPTTESPLFGLPQVVVTPHLGASTAEAQDGRGPTSPRRSPPPFAASSSLRRSTSTSDGRSPTRCGTSSPSPNSSVGRSSDSHRAFPAPSPSVPRAGSPP